MQDQHVQLLISLNVSQNFQQFLTQKHEDYYTVSASGGGGGALHHRVHGRR